MIEDTIKSLLPFEPGDNLYISARWYKKDDDHNFCVLVVHRAAAYLWEFRHGANRHYPEFVRELWQGINGKDYTYPEVIREFTKRNIKFSWESSR